MAGSQTGKSIVVALAHFAATALAVVVAWWWLGRPVDLPPSPLPAGQKLYCVSYAPFRGSQNPLVEGTVVPASQIDEDIALLSRYADCVRTYSVDDVQDYVLQSARRYGMKVLYGAWVSNSAEKTRQQIEATIKFAKAYPDVISAVVVGNEVLLRGDISAPDLIGYIRQIKAQVPEPVTYADVWEFWLRYPDVQNAVDFVTIHILPYWEDFPIPALDAAAHVDAIRSRVAAALPGKDIVIGEFGWPRAGRMRGGALPSPSNQARAIGETLALAQREKFRVNIIEAFDQPWKRALEGAAGRYWGIFDRATGAPYFTLGGAVSDHPDWLMQALAGIALAALTFAVAFAAGVKAGFAPSLWPRIAVLAAPSAILFGWAVETVPVESFNTGSWLRSLALAAVAVAAPLVCAAACAANRAPPVFAMLLGGGGRRRSAMDWALGGVLIALTLLGIEAALGLVFDPRYRDFVFAPLSAAVGPFLVLTVSAKRPAGPRAATETLAAAVLAASAGYVVLNEGFANWQAIWFCAGLIGLALILLRARAAPG